MTRKFNFNPGPATLPYSVLEKAQAEFVDYQNTGMSIIETSHRAKEFDVILEATKQNLRDIMGIPEDYEILFLGGGASLQFAMIPMNFLPQDQQADYINTGTWSKKSIKEAKLFGKVNIAGSSEDQNFNYIPKEINVSSDAAYVHITSNNTIFGTQWQSYPDTKDIPLMVDMSSDIMSRKIDVSKFALIYAGAQKNAGPAGATIVILRKNLLEKLAKRDIPTMLQYKTHLDKNSTFNTPPVFPIYMIKLVTEWIKESGGIEEIQKINEHKAGLLYNAIDSAPDYYKGTTAKDSRSLMNVTFRLPSEELEKQFIAEAAKQNLHGLKGHRSVGGIRASIYNAMPVEGVEKLCSFMKEFADTNKA